MTEDFQDDLISLNNLDQFNQELSKTLNQFRKDGRFCDVNLLINGSCIKAHRNVLAARSPYFEAMFSGNFQESDNGIVNIDMSHSADSFEVLEIAVCALYNGYCSVKAENIPELFHLASFFMFEELKLQLISRLIATSYTSLQNIIQSYVLAVTYSVVDLRNRCFQVMESRFHDYFIYQEDMLMLSIDQMKHLFAQQIQKYCSPLKIVMFLLRWIHRNSEDMENYMYGSLEMLKPMLKLNKPEILKKTSLFLESKKGDQISQEFVKNVQDFISHVVSQCSSSSETVTSALLSKHPSSLLSTNTKCIVLVVPDKQLIQDICKKEYEYVLNKANGKKIHMFHGSNRQQIMKLAIFDTELENWFDVGDFVPFARFDNKNNWKAATVNDKVYFVSLHMKMCYSLCLKTLICQEISINSILAQFDGEVKSVIPLAIDGKLYTLASNCIRAEVISNDEQYVTQQKYFKLKDDLTWAMVAQIQHKHTNTPASLLNACEKKVIAIKANIVVSLGKNLLEIKDGHVFDTVTSTIKKFSGPCYLSSPVRLLVKGDNLHIIDAEGWKRQYDWEIEEWMFPEKIDLDLVRWCRSVASITDYPCLSHIATNAGDSIWEMVNHGGYNSYLLKIDIDQDANLQTSKHTPPPFKYFTLCTAGMCSNDLLNTLKDSQYMDSDL